MEDKDILIKATGLPFDPVALAGLSTEQAALIEPFACAVCNLKDGMGLRILFKMDNWLISQMIAMLFKVDGSARDPQEIYEEISTFKFYP